VFELWVMLAYSDCFSPATTVHFTGLTTKRSRV